MPDEMRRDAPDRLIARWGAFYDLAVAIEGETAFGNENLSLDAPDVLADRQCIEKFISNEQHRLRRQIGDRFMPSRIGHRAFLGLAQDRTGFDQMDFAREPGGAQDPQRVGCEGSPPRTQPDVDRRWR